jgi:phage terminase small subunit
MPFPSTIVRKPRGTTVHHRPFPRRGDAPPPEPDQHPDPGVEGTDGHRPAVRDVDQRPKIGDNQSLIGPEPIQDYTKVKFGNLGMKSGVLTPFELNFVYYYTSISNFNVHDAWNRAIEGANSHVLGRVSGVDVLARPHVQMAIQNAMHQRQEALRFDSEKILEEICAIAFVDPGEMLNNDGSLKQLSEIPPHARKAINAIVQEESWKGKRKEVRLLDKLKALELLGRHLKLFKDELKVTVSYEDMVRESITDMGEGPTRTRLEEHTPPPPSIRRLAEHAPRQLNTGTHGTYIPESAPTRAGAREVDAEVVTESSEVEESNGTES